MEFYRKAVEELENIYDNLNRDYYNNELPKVIITIQSSPKGKSYGWYFEKKWCGVDNKNLIDEINISAEYLNRPIQNLVSTLQHEMVHLYCAINKIKDTSNKGVYHNGKFKSEAEKRGLKIDKAKTIGWSVTTPTQEFIDYINKLNINKESFNFFRTLPYATENDDNAEDENQEAKKRTTKYTCPICEASVRGECGLEIMCKKCNAMMEAKS